jgi:hypothetical protein
MTERRFKKTKNFEKIENNRIILDGSGEFPKDLIIFGHKKTQTYRIIKTKFGKFQLVK